jgi:hypothetical protein
LLIFIISNLLKNQMMKLDTKDEIFNAAANNSDRGMPNPAFQMPGHLTVTNAT